MEDNIKYFKGKYIIVFFDWTDEWIEAMFNNIKEICEYKKLDINPKSYNLVKIELYRALKRPNQTTRMLNGKLMHVYLIDMTDENELEF